MSGGEAFSPRRRFLATVKDNLDEDKAGRIIVECPELEDEQFGTWVEPVPEYPAWLTPPPVGAVVEIEVDLGADEPQARYSGGLHYGDAAKEYLQDVLPGTFWDAYPDVQHIGLHAASGNAYGLALADSPDGMALFYHFKDEKMDALSLSSKQAALLTNWGAGLAMDADSGNVQLFTPGSDFLTLGGGKASLFAGGGGALTLDAGVHLMGDKVEMAAGEMSIFAPVAMGPAALPALVGAPFMTALMAFMAALASGAAVPPLTPVGAAATAFSSAAAAAMNFLSMTLKTSP